MDKKLQSKFFKYYQEYFFTFRMDIPLVEGLLQEALENKYYDLYSFTINLLCRQAIEAGDMDRFCEYLKPLKSMAEEKGGYPLVYCHINEGLNLLLKSKLPKEAIAEFQKALNIYQDKQLTNGLTLYTIHQFMGVAYRNLTDNISAYRHLSIALQTNLNEIFKFHKGITYQWMALIERDFSFTSSALQKALKSAEIFRKYKVDVRLSDSLNLVGSFYIGYAQFDEAMSVFTEGIEIAEKYNLTDIISDSYNGIGALYSAKNDFLNAIENYQKSVKYRNNAIESRNTLNNIGNAYLNSGLYEDAEKYFLQALEIVNSINDDFLRTRLYNNLALNCYHLQRFDDAIEYLKQAEPLAESLNDLDIYRKIYHIYTGIYDEQENYELKADYAWRCTEKTVEYYENRLKINGEFIKMLNSLAIN